MLKNMAWAAAIGGFVLVLAAAEDSTVQQDPPSMTDPEGIVDWLLENPLLAGVVVTVVVLVVKIGRWTEKVDSAAKDFRSFAKESFPDFQDEIRNALADLAQRLPLRPVRRGSPLERAHSRFPGHALTPTGVMAIRCKQFHLPDL